MTDLRGLWVALSGSVPALEELQANDWDVQGFHWMVKNLVTALLDNGVGIVHGCHPSYTTHMADVAAKVAGCPDKVVRMLAIPAPQFYPTQADWDRFVNKHPYADAEPVDDPRTPLDEALEDLATRLSEYGQAFVCVGGRAGRHGLRTNKQQVEDELDKALDRQRPVYLLGGCGGLSRKLFQDRFERNLSILANGLEDDKNQKLAYASPWDAPELVLQGLRELRSKGRIHAAPLPQPRRRA